MIFSFLLTIPKLFDWTNHSEWFNPSSLLISVGGVLIGIIIYFKSKRIKKPSFAIRSVNIISDSLQSLDNIKVFYRGEETANLTISKVAICNLGNETLSYSDMANTDFFAN